MCEKKDKTTMVQTKAHIAQNDKVGPGLYHLVCDCAVIAQRVLPGQFVHLRIPDDALLMRRPLSVSFAEEHLLHIFYKVVGKGSKLMSTLHKGDSVDVVGPLGNSFVLDYSCECAILLGGGIGAAPLIGLAKSTAQKKSAFVTLIIGAQDAQHHIFQPVIGELSDAVILATDDGSLGVRGLVSDVFFEMWKTRRLKTKKCAVYACGPRGMLAALHAFFEKESPDAVFWMSLEEKMACGVGACQGCVVPTVDGYRRVCVEGPIFDSRHILWGELNNNV
ncbi:MAG: dihydroorotate dehydrogenase electron transfer subunit [Candidatus Omnitrophica bacterium]|nr:dihydroorotate dehydrogenase electron transfer subunit [Candidatus Omnitrophota bacterium]